MEHAKPAIVKKVISRNNFFSHSTNYGSLQIDFISTLINQFHRFFVSLWIIRLAVVVMINSYRLALISIIKHSSILDYLDEKAGILTTILMSLSKQDLLTRTPLTYIQPISYFSIINIAVDYNMISNVID